MRKSDNKTEGYIILPVVIVKKDPGKPISESNQQLLNSSYSNLVQIVNDLTSHDEVFRRQLEQYKLSRNEQCLIDKIIIASNNKKPTKPPENAFFRPEHAQKIVRPPQLQLDIFQAIKDGIFSCIAQAGNRVKTWNDFTTALQSFQVKVDQQLKRELHHNLQFKTATQQFTADLKSTINESVTQKEAINWVLQHYLTLPVFTKIFRTHNFVRTNPMSQALERVISHLSPELQKLRTSDHHYQTFLKWVDARTKSIQTWRERDAFVKEFYGEFFKIFDNKIAKKFGIVYTPNEVVDFMLGGVESLLSQHFNTNFNDPVVNVLDPFAGTGTFLTHLLANPNLISNQNLLSKYQTGVFAKEIFLLPYYLTSLNLQATVSNRLPGDQIEPYRGIVLTDTFAEYEQANNKQNQFHIKDTFLQINQSRVDQQTKTKIDVIITNPPYYRSQSRPGDLNQRTIYKILHTKWKSIISQLGKIYSLNSLYNPALGVDYAGF